MECSVALSVAKKGPVFFPQKVGNVEKYSIGGTNYLYTCRAEPQKRPSARSWSADRLLLVGSIGRNSPPPRLRYRGPFISPKPRCHSSLSSPPQASEKVHNAEDSQPSESQPPKSPGSDQIRSVDSRETPEPISRSRPQFEQPSTSGRNSQRFQRAPVTWRRRKTDEPLGARDGLSREVAETVVLLKQERDPEMVKALLLRLERVSRGLVVSAFDEFERRGEARCCITVLRFILDQGNYWQEIRYVNKAIDLLVRLKLWVLFDSLFEIVTRERVPLDTATYNTLLKGYAASGRPKEAVALVEEMVKVGLQPDAISYNGLMSAYAKVGDVDRAAKVLDNMKAAGVAPNAYHFSVLLNAYAKVDDLDGAQSAFDRMTDEGVRPDRLVYQSLINLHCKSGSPSKAHDLLKEMKLRRLPPTFLSYTKVLDGLAKLGEAARADEVLEMMVAGGTQGTAAVYSLVTRAHIKAGDLAAAKVVLGKAIDGGISLEKDQIAFGTFGFLIREFVKQGDVVTAEDVLRKLRTACPSGDERAFNALQMVIDDHKQLTHSLPETVKIT